MHKRLRLNGRSLDLVFLGLLLATPVRIRYSFLVFNSIAVFDLVVLLAGITLTIKAICKGRFFIGNRTVITLLAIPLILGILSLTWTRDFRETVHYIVVAGESLVAYWVILNLLHGRGLEATIRFIEVLALAILVPSFLSWFKVAFPPYVAFDPESSYYTNFLAGYYARLSSPLVGPSNNLATVLAYFFFIVWACYDTVRWPQLAFLAALILAAIVMTFSMGALLAIVLVIPLFIYWGRGTTKRALRVITVACCMAFVGFLGARAVSEEFRVHYEYLVNPVNKLETSGVERVELVREAVEAIRQSPLFGYGADIVPGYETVPRGLRGVAHNAYVQGLVFFGLVFGPWIGISLFGLLFVLYREMCISTGVRRRLFSGTVAAVLCQLLIFGVHASYEATLLKPFFYLSIGISLMLIKAYDRELKTNYDI